MSTEENKRLVRHLFEEGMNKDNPRLIDELIAPNHTMHGIPSPGTGPEGFRQVLGMFRSAFPDMQIAQEDIIAEGDRVATRGVMTGTHRGDFMGVPATGKHFEASYIDMWRVEGARLVENWVQMDMIGLMQQLGLGAGGTARREEPAMAGGGSREASYGGYRMSSEENKALVRESFLESWNKGNLDILDKVYGSDYVSHDPALPHPLHGAGELKQALQMYRNAFPNLHMTVEDQIASADRVVTRWVARGTHKGDFMGAPATGKEATVVGFTISRLSEGKIVEEWTNWDTLGLMHQLGLTPSEGRGM